MVTRANERKFTRKGRSQEAADTGDARSALSLDGEVGEL